MGNVALAAAAVLGTGAGPRTGSWDRADLTGLRGPSSRGRTERGTRTGRGAGRKHDAGTRAEHLAAGSPIAPSGPELQVPDAGPEDRPPGTSPARQPREGETDPECGGSSRCEQQEEKQKLL